MNEIKLTEMSAAALNAVKAAGGRMSMSALAEAVGRTEKSVGANVTDLKRKGLAVREPVDEGGEKPVTYVVLTDDGVAFEG